MRNPFTHERQALLQDLGRQVFGDQIGTWCSLAAYRSRPPHCYFNRDVVAHATAFMKSDLKSDDSSFRWSLREHAGDFDVAFRTLGEINRADFHHAMVDSSDAPATHRLIHDDVAPSYLRLLEPVCKTFLLPFAHRERRSRNKQIATTSSDIFAGAKRTAFGPYLGSVDLHTRNAIAHGTVRYDHTNVIFVDRNPYKTPPTEKTRAVPLHTFVQQADELLDLCNALAASYRLLFAKADELQNIQIPVSVIADEVMARCASASWRVTAAYEGHLGELGRQLSFRAETDFADARKVFLFGAETVSCAESLGAGFDRYHVSVARGEHTVGWLSAEAAQVSNADGDPAVLAAEAMKAGSAMFFGPRELSATPFPMRAFSVGTYLESLRNGFDFDSTRIALGGREVILRHSKMHRQRSRSRVRAWLVMRDTTPEDAVPWLREHVASLGVICSVRSRARYFGRMQALLPLDLLELNIFLKDHRPRRLVGYGLGSDLLCRAAITRAKIRYVPLATGVQERQGAYVLDWNKRAVSQEVLEASAPPST